MIGHIDLAEFAPATHRPLGQEVGGAAGHIPADLEFAENRLKPCPT